MVPFARLVLWLIVSNAIVQAAAVQNPSGKSKPKVEFKWLEDSPVKELTEEKGIKTTCGFELYYPHKKPVLTNTDVASARLRNHGSVMGIPGDHFTVTFEFTWKAKKSLVDRCGDASMKTLAVFVDGKYWGTTPFNKSEAAAFTSQAGFINSKAEAERIAEAFK